MWVPYMRGKNLSGNSIQLTKRQGKARWPKPGVSEEHRPGFFFEPLRNILEWGILWNIGPNIIHYIGIQLMEVLSSCLHSLGNVAFFPSPVGAFPNHSIFSILPRITWNNTSGIFFLAFWSSAFTTSWTGNAKQHTHWFHSSWNVGCCFFLIIKFSNHDSHRADNLYAMCRLTSWTPFHPESIPTWSNHPAMQPSTTFSAKIRSP